MSASKSHTETTHTHVLDRLVGAVPEHYRKEFSRLAQSIRDHLPPVMVEHRIDALQSHVDRRLNEIEAKVEEILRRLEKR
jgi:nitrate/nitrite-specific signal transduction histidine kinase